MTNTETVSTERRNDIADALEDMAETLGLAKGHRSILQNAAVALREPSPLHKEGEAPHLWGVQYSDNNRVDPHNVFLTEGSAMMRAMEAAIPAKVVPLFLHAALSAKPSGEE